MGILAKLFGREDDDSPVESAVVSSDTTRAAVNELTSAITALLRAMDVDDAPRGNPAWEGRMRDLRSMTRDLQLLDSRPRFTRDELFEVLTTVRPLYRGQAPDAFAHLDAENSRVSTALEQVYAAV